MTVLDDRKVHPQRDHQGRYLIGGKAHTRVTTIAEAIDDRFNLEKWKIRTTVAGLVQRHDLYAAAAAIDPTDRDALNRVCEQAMEAAGSSAGANLGTALHAFTEQVDAGRPVTAPPDLVKDLDAYTATMQAAGVRVEAGMLEQVVVLHDLGVAGTFDRLVKVDGWPLPVIADLKTGANLDWGWTGIAIQLACYANADELYDPATGQCRPMPAVDRRRAIVMHLPVGQATCTLYVVDIAAGWEAVRLCLDVREWRKRKNLASPFTAPLEQRTAWLQGRLENLRDNHPEALKALAGAWPPGVPTFKQGGHTGAHLSEIAAVVHQVETAHQVPFGPPDPDDQIDTRPPPEMLAEIEGRLDDLPDDLREYVTANSKFDGVPNLRTRQATVDHALLVQSHLAAAEQTAGERLEHARQILQALTGGEAPLIGAVQDACGLTRSAWTSQQIEILDALHRAVEHQHLYFVDIDGHMALAHPDGEGHLVIRHGAKREALAAVKHIADAFGLQRPKSVAEASANPALLALDALMAVPPSEPQERP